MQDSTPLPSQNNLGNGVGARYSYRMVTPNEPVTEKRLMTGVARVCSLSNGVRCECLIKYEKRMQATEFIYFVAYFLP